MPRLLPQRNLVAQTKCDSLSPDVRRGLKLAVRAGFGIKTQRLANSGVTCGRRQRDDVGIYGISGSRASIPPSFLYCIISA
jgi:hypothetical protein